MSALNGTRCTHWDGTAGVECGSEAGVRPFLQGPRCEDHDPNVLEGGKP